MLFELSLIVRWSKLNISNEVKLWVAGQLLIPQYNSEITVRVVTGDGHWTPRTSYYWWRVLMDFFGLRLTWIQRERCEKRRRTQNQWFKLNSLNINLQEKKRTSRMIQIMMSSSSSLRLCSLMTEVTWGQLKGGGDSSSGSHPLSDEYLLCTSECQSRTETPRRELMDGLDNMMSNNCWELGKCFDRIKS